MTVDDLDQAYLQEILDYDPKTGIVIWKERPRTDFNKLHSQKRWCKAHTGKQAGNISLRDWRLDVCLFGTTFKLDQLLWKMMFNETIVVYHKNHWFCDNRMENLTSRKKENTKYVPSDLRLSHMNNLWYILSDSQLGYPSHCLGIHLTKKQAKSNMLELAEKFNTGWKEEDAKSSN